MKDTEECPELVTDRSRKAARASACGFKSHLLRMTKILAIETSCDETAVAVLECSGGLEKPSFDVLSHELYSQASLHAEYGGVYPSLAKREHAKNLIPLLLEALKKSDSYTKAQTAIEIDENKLKEIFSHDENLLKDFLEVIPTIDAPDIDAIAVTQGPGLEPALWVGINFAQALSLVWDKPLVPVNHMEGHFFSVLRDDEITFPALALLVSGGHTELVHSKKWFDYEILGETRDDAVGEAFDKVARMLELPYPGGPHLSKLAENAREHDVRSDISLPRPMMDSDDLDFSFSGLKTAVLYYLKEHENLSKEEKMGLAREFEDAVIDVLISKTQKAIEEFSPKAFVLAGGVAANTELRKRLNKLLEEYEDTHLLIAPRDLTGDNAVMIGIAGYLRLLEEAEERAEHIEAEGNLSL